MTSLAVIGTCIFITSACLGWGAIFTILTLVLTLTTCGGIGFLFWDKHQMFVFAENYLENFNNAQNEDDEEGEETSEES